MTKGLWLLFDNREKDLKKYKDFDEIYLVNKWKYYSREDRLKYYKKLEKAGYKPYISINYNDPEKGIDLTRFKNDIDYFSKNNCRIMLDYIRYKSIKWDNLFKTKSITNIVESIKDQGVSLKLAVWKFPLCFLVGQDAFTLKKHCDEMHFMIYGSKPHKFDYTSLLLKIHNWLFSNQASAIPGWDVTKQEFKDYKKKAGKRFSVFRWKTYKELK